MKQTPLERRTPLKRGPGPQRKSAPRKPRAISPASPAQRKKARTEPCVVTGAEAYEGATVDPAHLASRAHGGCDSPFCVVPLRRDLHTQFDDGALDLLPYLVGKRVPELCHALEHYEGSLTALTRRLTGQRDDVSRGER